MECLGTEEIPNDVGLSPWNDERHHLQGWSQHLRRLIGIYGRPKTAYTSEAFWVNKEYIIHASLTNADVINSTENGRWVVYVSVDKNTDGSQ